MRGGHVGRSTERRKSRLGLVERLDRRHRRADQSGDGDACCTDTGGGGSGEPDRLNGGSDVGSVTDDPAEHLLSAALDILQFAHAFGRGVGVRLADGLGGGFGRRFRFADDLLDVDERLLCGFPRQVRQIGE
ncbi:MAG: hypothetical protein ACO3UX_10525 [Candidatus Nanopelagicales bacterium]